MGHYIADFCCPRQKLVIEIDGSVHNGQEQKSYDHDRAQDIEALGFGVLRFNNSEVINQTKQVVEKIRQRLK
ncbi:hypothetical protein COX69_04070 [Candidatus Falkowbacteria bacterium CG_4_10_14_0_2_um_filter_48_10]|nr:MAG: hypothetical protein COX69_04070 [Candidatus Falkowbacteria bacterium CG_4_10_14_0_2_um_filter_48_10]